MSDADSGKSLELRKPKPEKIIEVDGEVVDEYEFRSPDLYSVLDYKNGEFVDISVKDEAVKLGKSAAELVYTEDGRKKTEQVLEKMRAGLKLSPSFNVDDKQVLFYVHLSSGAFTPLSTLDSAEEPYRKLLNRALNYVRDGTTTILEDGVNIGLKMRVQKEGFKEGFDKVVEESPYKDEKEEEKPWYLKKSNL